MIIANMISARHFAKQSHAKNRIGYRNAGGHSKCDKFIINFYIMDNLSCRFDIMDNESHFFCVLTYAIIYVLIHQIIFRFYLLKYSLFFSSTLVLTSFIDVVFILSVKMGTTEMGF